MLWMMRVGILLEYELIIDISLPLCRGKVVTLKSGGKTSVSFKYERSPNLCYWCGHLTHDNKSCNLWIQSKGSPIVDQQQFGPYLRATPYQLARNNVIFIPRFFENRSSYIHIAAEELGAAPTIVVTENSNPSPGVDIPDMETDIQKEVINFETFLNSLSTAELGKELETRKSPMPNIPIPLFAHFAEDSGADFTSLDFLSKLDEIDRGIKKYDSILGVSEGSSKKNSKTIEEACVESDFERASNPIGQSLKVDIADDSPMLAPTPQNGKWTCYTKLGISKGHNVRTNPVALGKRAQDNGRIISELPNKRQ